MTKASDTKLESCYVKNLQSSQKLSYSPNLRGNKFKEDVLWLFDFFQQSSMIFIGRHVGLDGIRLWREMEDKIDTRISWPCKHFFASKIVLRVIVCCLRGVGSMSSSRRIPRFIVLFYSRHRWLFFVASLLAYVVVASFLCLRVVGSSFRRLRYILRQALDVWGIILYRLYLHKLYLPFFAWYLVALLPCYPVTLLPCYLVTLLLCYLVTLLLCYPVTLLPCNLVTLLPCYSVTLILCYLVTLLPCYAVTLLPCYPVTLLLRCTLLPCCSDCYLGNLLLCYLVPRLLCYPVALLPCHSVILLLYYLVSLLLCYLVTLLPCHFVALLTSYSVT